MFVGYDVRKEYTSKIETSIVSDKQKDQARKDQEALALAAKKRNERIKARREARDNRRIDFDVKMETANTELEIMLKQEKENLPNKIQEIKEETKNRLLMIEESREAHIEQEIQKAKENTNYLARKYNLPEPNNPEALKHDRFHCIVCNTRLHWPNEYKKMPEEAQMLLGRDEDVRHICCDCFAKLDDGEILEITEDKEATKEIRMLVYNPEEAVAEKVEEKIETEKIRTVESAKYQIQKTQQMTKERLAYIKSKIKRNKKVMSMLEKPKEYNSIDGEDTVINGFLSGFVSRYNTGTT